MAGDEDEPCLDASLYLKRTIPSSGFALLAKTGHALNLEEPDLFNRLVDDFVHQVDAGRWELRDPRSIGASMLSQKQVGSKKFRCKEALKAGSQCAAFAVDRNSAIRSRARRILSTLLA